MISDLTHLDQLKKHLAQYGLSPQKSFGQNFLISAEILDQIVTAAEVSHQDTVVEVGAGPGVLSQRLAPLVRQLISLEIDEQMIEPWEQIMEASQNAVIINQDVLEYVPPTRSYKLVANIPYYITSPILKHFLRNQKTKRPDLIVLLIQKEVAQRICSQKKPTLLSWEIRVFGEPELVCMVPPECFFPPPKVDSAVLRIRLHDQPLLSESEMDNFFHLMTIAYKQPRKTLMNNLLAPGRWSKDELLEILTQLNIQPELRPHQISFEDWKLLSRAFLS